MLCFKPLPINGEMVPCGKCAACLTNKRKEWTFRLNQELLVSSSSFFITLTYDDEHIPVTEDGLPTFSKRDIQLFIKRLRKNTNRKISYYIVSEYGEKTYRPHYHGFIFNLNANQQEATDLILKSWKNGHVKIGTTQSASIAYVTKYIINRNNIKGLSKPFALISKRPAIGSSYLELYGESHLIDKEKFFVRQNGFKQAIPRYYRDKLFTKEEKQAYREKLLDKLKSPLESYKHCIDPIKTMQSAQDYYTKLLTENTKSKLY